MIETCLEVEGCLGAALVKLLGGDMDFKIVDGFVMALETGFTFVLVNVNGWGGGAGFSLVGGTGGIPPYEPYVPPHKNGVPPIKSESCPPSSPFIMGGTCRIFLS